MPEFHLNGAHRKEFRDLPYLARGFIEAMFFTESASGISIEDFHSPKNQEDIREGRADGCLPEDAGFEELHETALANILRFCADFEAAAGDLLEQAYSRDYDAEQAGRDLWYTSQGHGVGFWDRDVLSADGLGDKLSDVCRYREAQVWFADHVEFGNAPFVYCEIEFARAGVTA